MKIGRSRNSSNVFGKEPRLGTTPCGMGTHGCDHYSGRCMAPSPGDAGGGLGGLGRGSARKNKVRWLKGIDRVRMSSFFILHPSGFILPRQTPSPTLPRRTGRGGQTSRQRHGCEYTPMPHHQRPPTLDGARPVNSPKRWPTVWAVGFACWLAPFPRPLGRLCLSRESATRDCHRPVHERQSARGCRCP